MLWISKPLWITFFHFRILISLYVRMSGSWIPTCTCNGIYELLFFGLIHFPNAYCLLAYCCPSYSTMTSSQAQDTGKVFFLVRSTATKLSLVGSLMANQPNASSAWAATHKLSISSRLFVSACPSLLGSRYIILVVSGEPDPAGLPPLGPVTRQSIKLRRSHATLLHGHIKMIFVSLLLASHSPIALFQLAIYNLLREPANGHPDGVAQPSQVSYAQVSQAQPSQGGNWARGSIPALLLISTWGTRCLHFNPRILWRHSVWNFSSFLRCLLYWTQVSLA